MSPKIDRRILRTRKMLKEALLALIIERGYDALTIQDITDRADLRRATFYQHYHDKQELLFVSLQETFDELSRATEQFMQIDVIGGKSRPEAFLLTFQHVADNRELYRNLLRSQAGAVINHHIRAYIAAHILKTLAPLADSDLPLPRDLIANFIAGAEVSLILWWLEENPDYTAEALAHAAHQLLLRGLADLLGEHLTITTPTLAE